MHNHFKLDEINWQTSHSHLLLNPTYSPKQQQVFQKILTFSDNFEGHIWLSTSGSSSQKWVGLSKKALLHSAAAVNLHLESTQEDHWINILPDFHVGGLGIWARAYLSGATIHNLKFVMPKWNPIQFCSFTNQVKGTLTSLVPTQVFDLIQTNLEAPPSLRAAIVGGGYLSKEIYERAIQLKWPILPSFGATECASQIATASLISWKENRYPDLTLLPHVDACVDEGCLSFSSASLLSAYALIEKNTLQFIDPKKNGWWKSEDKGNVFQRIITFSGRADSCVKIKGETVDLFQLNKILQTCLLKKGLTCECLLMTQPDQRSGQTLILVTTCQKIDCLINVLHLFHQEVLPFEKITYICKLPDFPRSSLGKILKTELMKMVSLAQMMPCNQFFSNERRN